MGYFPVADERLYVVYALRTPSCNVADFLRARAVGAHVVLLVPTNRSIQGQGATVVIDSPVPSKEQVIRDGVAASGIAGIVPAIYSAPDGAELVVDKRLKKIWVYGVELLGLTPDSHGYHFIEMLAGAKGKAVSSDAITEALSAARCDTDGTTAARQAKSKAKKAVNEVLKKIGRTEQSDPFPVSGRSCYRCALRPFVVDALPLEPDEAMSSHQNTSFAA